MTKLLIVDDEPLVQIGIKSMLNWADYGIEICGTAVNGQNALDMIEEYSPELVITDIRMPIMNGLDLAKTCREKYGNIPLFIFLTSYEEFQLIKEAMSYEAVDYLIKLELNAETLLESVQKALSRLESLRVSIEYRQSGRPLLQSYYEKFFMRLLHNLFESEEQFELQSKDLNLSFTEQCYFAALCEIQENNHGDMEYSKLMNLYNSTLQMAREIITKHLPAYVVSLDMKHFAVVLHLNSMESYQKEEVKHAFLNTSEMVNNYFNVTLFTGVGSPVSHPLKISESYQEARQAFARMDRSLSIVFFNSSDTESIRNAFNISVFKGEITKAFNEFDTDVLSRTLTEIIELFEAHPLRFPQAADCACNILYLALSLLPDGETNMAEIFSSYSDGYRSIYRFTNVEQIVEWMAIFRDGLCETLKSKRKTYKAHVITNVQKYIQNHVTEKLSLNEVAGVFGLSPNYLSILFKKNCQLGFSEYIARAKIDKAKKLLLERDIKIYEVADHLGFESAFYFSKVFKKVTGYSPRDFIQQNTKDPEGK
ncbi:response regulator [Clostridium boliviensis]|uniref:Stage 0 sporulation protein A homolog n=1 Tax=Clostridium boliviensis TaxID=318465 RepID=A0ABU4GL75_9CLOT|nr:response regulator [Clostridium boliviensis]MDW2798361.1 response regulator [Clostridium boliviensis]